MGLCDNVTGLDLYCPKCGKPLKGWQTKSTPNPYLNDVDFREVYNFYTSCECGYRVEFTRKPAEGLSEFDRIKEASE